MKSNLVENHVRLLGVYRSFICRVATVIYFIVIFFPTISFALEPAFPASSPQSAEEQRKKIEKWKLPLDKFTGIEEELTPEERKEIYGYEQSSPQADMAGYTLPGSAFSIPVGYGGSWGDYFIGIGFQDRAPFQNKVDGVASLGFGIGNSYKYVGLETQLNFVDLHKFLNTVYTFSFKLHHLFSDGTSVAIGVNDFIDINGVDDGGTSYYAVVSHAFRLRESSLLPFSLLVTHLGIGNGQFRTQDDIANQIGRINVFGGVGLYVLRPLALVADWNGQNIQAGVSVTPFRNFPFIVSVGAQDFLSTSGDGIRFFLAFCYGNNFLSQTDPSP